MRGPRRPFLQRANFKRTRVADVPFDAFLGLTSLERLNLSRNSLSSRPLSADLFKQMGKLAVVSLAHNKIAGELNSDTLPWYGAQQRKNPR